MSFPLAPIATKRTGYLTMAWQGLRSWTPRQVIWAALSSVVVALIIGIATVLIPNSIFARDIPPVWWNYPVWILTSIFSGMLIATYIKPGRTSSSGALDANIAPSMDTDRVRAEETKTSRMGIAGGVLAWFAVGCPVCNKLALLALGYAGAISWFAPVQPFLALFALAFTSAALVVRLKGQIACPVKVSDLLKVSA